MKTARFNFSERLNDLLRPALRNQVITIQFKGNQSAKHLIESLRIPHTEVGEVRINGVPVSLGYIVQDGDQLDIFAIDPSRLSLPPPRFLLDNHLGKLATFLRTLGFDANYCNSYQDDELARIAGQEGYALLTRDRGLLMRREIVVGYCLRSLEPKEQLAEVVWRFNLTDAIQPFQRCLRCNHLLEPVEKSIILDRLEPLTRRYFNEFHLCPACDKVYWKGSHYEHMQDFLSSIYPKQETMNEQ